MVQTAILHIRNVVLLSLEILLVLIVAQIEVSATTLCWQQMIFARHLLGHGIFESRRPSHVVQAKRTFLTAIRNRADNLSVFHNQAVLTTATIGTKPIAAILILLILVEIKK